MSQEQTFMTSKSNTTYSPPEPIEPQEVFEILSGKRSMRSDSKLKELAAHLQVPYNDLASAGITDQEVDDYMKVKKDTDIRALVDALAKRRETGHGAGSKESAQAPLADTNIQFIDIRGYNMKGGKLPSALPMGTEEFNEDNSSSLDDVCKVLKDKDLVVLYGDDFNDETSFCVARLQTRMHAHHRTNHTPRVPEIRVLRGGWKEWSRRYAQEPGMIEPKPN